MIRTALTCIRATPQPLSRSPISPFEGPPIYGNSLLDSIYHVLYAIHHTPCISYTIYHTSAFNLKDPPCPWPRHPWPLGLTSSRPRWPSVKLQRMKCLSCRFRNLLGVDKPNCTWHVVYSIWYVAHRVRFRNLLRVTSTKTSM